MHVYIHIFLHSTVPVPFCRWSGRTPLPLYRNTSVSCSTYWIPCCEPGHHTYLRSRCRYGEVSSRGWAPWVEVACAWCWPWCNKACLTSNGLNSVSWRFVGSLVSCRSRIVEWHLKHCNWNFSDLDFFAKTTTWFLVTSTIQYRSISTTPIAMAPCGTYFDIIFPHLLGCLDLRQACCRCHHSSCYTSICRAKEVGKASRWNLATNLVQRGRGMVYISSKTHSRWMMIGCLGWRFHEIKWRSFM